MESWGMGELLWENNRGEQFVVNHHWVPEDSPRYLSENEGEFLCGYDPDYLRRKLIHRLQDGKPVVFELRFVINGERIRAGRLVLEKIPENQAELEPVFCCSPNTLVPGMALMEGCFLHQLSLILHECQRSRLGSEKRTALINRHWRCPGNTPLSKIIALENPATAGAGCREEGYEAVRRLCKEIGAAEQGRIAKSLAERLLFAEDALRKKFLKELEIAEPQMGKAIENQLIF